MPECVLCGANAVINRQEGSSRTIYNCHVCGMFVISDLAMQEVEQNVHQVAAFLASRHLAKLQDTVFISYDNAKQDKDYVQLTVHQIVNRFPKSFSERMDMVLLNLATLSGYAGAEFKVDSLEVWPYFYLTKGDFDAMSYMIKSLQKAELVDINYFMSTFFPCGVVISPKGWDRIAELQNAQTSQHNAFLVFPRTEETWSVAMRLSARKAVEDCGYRAIESSSVSQDNAIGYAMIAQVKSSKFVICDLSENFSGAYFCYALALSLGKVAVLTCHESQKHKLKVNTNELNVVMWQDKKDLYNSVSNLIRALVI